MRASSLGRNSEVYFTVLFLALSMTLFSVSSDFHLRLILISCSASSTISCTTNRSMAKLASANYLLTIRPIFSAISKLTSLTLFLYFKGICCNIFITSSVLLLLSDSNRDKQWARTIPIAIGTKAIGMIKFQNPPKTKKPLLT